MARDSIMEVEENNNGANTTLDQSRGAGDEPTATYEELVSLCSPIAKPMASRKLTKQIYKLLRKISAAEMRKDCSPFGTKAVGRALRNNKKGFLVLAGDVTPIDLISHMPVFAEEKDVPYMFVPSQEDLGSALGSGPCMCVLIVDNEAISKNYAACFEEVKSLPTPIG